MTCEDGDVIVVVVPIEIYKRALGLLGRYLHRTYRIAFSGKKAYFPLRSDANQADVRDIADRLNARMTYMRGELLPRRVRSMKINLLEKKFHIKLPKSVNCVGDILLLNAIPRESENRKKAVGDILRNNFGVRAVFLKSQAVSGEIRVARWERISGWGDTFTLHSENGCVYAVDLSKVFFNPRLSTERLRVARDVKDSEIVIDMFAGVGSFSILIAKLKKVKVFAIDINPSAVEFMKINKLLNSVDIAILEGDAREVIHRISMSVDRIIMNYPERSIEFIQDAIMKIKNEGVIYLYIFVRSREPLEIGRQIVFSKLLETGVEVKDCRMRIVEEVAPFKYILCADIRLGKVMDL
ncbi:MAG: class I SAM-dependent methyltransferase family protein [Candidatus Njordarchaeota archaeon]